MNCWEFMKCGREFGGLKAHELGFCQAYPDNGKQCAKVAMKIFDCLKCDYNSEHYQHNNSKFTSNCSNNNCDI